MKSISQSEIPSDYFYYRSHTDAFSKFIVEKEKNGSTEIREDGNYGYVRHYFWGLFSYARFEKSDILPTRELLRKYGMKRGILLWSGWHKEKPEGDFWFSFGYFFSKKFHHSTRSAFSLLESLEYWKKWNPNARNHRNKIQKLLSEGKISIQTDASWEEFRSIYKIQKLPHNHKQYFLKRQDFFEQNNSKDFRILLAYIDGIPLAGAIFLDDTPTSTYLIAFQNPEAKKYHLGLAIMDRWFADSQKLRYRYLDLDHMKDVLDNSSYAGYTQFKSEIADFDVKFPKVWMKIFL